MRRDNRGLSLVELIMVLALMTLVGSILAYSINMITGRPAQKCSQKIVYSLDRHRTTAMGKIDASYKLHQDTNGTVYLIESVTDSSGTKTTNVPIGENVTVKYTCGGVEKDLASEDLVLGFERGSGAFKKQSDGTYCTQIVVSKASKSYTIVLVPLTGKVSIN